MCYDLCPHSYNFIIVLIILCHFPFIFRFLPNSHRFLCVLNVDCYWCVFINLMAKVREVKLCLLGVMYKMDNLIFCDKCYFHEVTYWKGFSFTLQFVWVDMREYDTFDLERYFYQYQVKYDAEMDGRVLWYRNFQVILPINAFCLLHISGSIYFSLFLTMVNFRADFWLLA